MAGKSFWFAKRRYGFGAGLPITWQGWVLLIALVAAVGLAATFEGTLRWAAIVAVVAAFASIAAQRTEGGWRWRWGSAD